MTISPSQPEWENPDGPRARKGFSCMKQQRHSVDQIIAKLRRADVELDKGQKIPGNKIDYVGTACRSSSG